MTRELSAWFPTGSTLYAVLFNASAQPWDGATFDTTPTAGEWANYAITMAEDSTIGNYVGTFPGSQAAGAYSYRVYKRAGGSPATTDPVVWTGEGQWTGSAWAYQSGDAFARVGAAGAGLTALGDTRIANLDATVSSRSTFAGGAVASVTADVGITQVAADKVWNTASRTLTAFGFSVTVGTNGDKTGYSLTAAYDPAKTAAQAGDAMTLTTGERTSIGTAVWASTTRTLSSFGTLVADIWTASTAPTAAAIAAAVWTAANVTAAAANKLADHVLRRTTANVEASSDGDTLGARSLYGAAARLVHKIVAATGTLTVYKADDTAALTTATLTSDAAADPTVAVDPAP